MKTPGVLLVVVWRLILSTAVAQDVPPPADYRSELDLPYCTVDGKTETLNAFLPTGVDQPTPAIVEIHGGWWSGGTPSVTVESVPAAPVLRARHVAIFCVQYRRWKEGGFPECIRDCRNAVRFVRQNAARFHIDPNRIGCMGGSAGGHLSLMVAMAPEDFDDGGPTPELRGVSAKVCDAFSWIPVTDFVRFWGQGPEDVVTDAEGHATFRPIDGNIPDDSRPHLRVLFHGVTPDTAEHQSFYTRMSPVGNVRKDVPPLLICDGGIDPVIPGLHGKALQEKLQVAGADSSYWLTPNKGHGFPAGPGFDKVLADFIDRTLVQGPAKIP